MPDSDTLVILSPGFPANEADTTCLPAQQQFVRALNHRFPRLQIIILAFHYPFAKAGYRWYGNTVIPFNGGNARKLSRPVLWMRVWKVLRKLRQERRLLGLFSFWCSESALVGRYFSKYYHIKHFVWICGQDARAQNRLVRLIRPKPDSLVAMSDFLAEEFYRNHQIRPEHIVYNGLDPTLFDAHYAPGRDIDVIGVGSLIALKQFEVLVGVVRQLRDKRPGIRCLICGEGPEREKLEALIRKYGLVQDILLSGEKPHNEVLRLLQRSRILLHPSSYEGFPGVCLEALYAGASVISFCQPVNRHVAHWHIAANAEDMLRKSLDLLADPALDFSPVLVNDMETSAVAIMQLFGYSETAMS